MLYLYKPCVWFSSVHLINYIAALNEKSLFRIKFRTRLLGIQLVTCVLLSWHFWLITQGMQLDVRFCLLLPISELPCDNLTALSQALAFFFLFNESRTFYLLFNLHTATIICGWCKRPMSMRTNWQEVDANSLSSWCANKAPPTTTNTTTTTTTFHFFFSGDTSLPIKRSMNTFVQRSINVAWKPWN